MSNGLLVRPVKIYGITAAANGGMDPAFPAAALLDPSPKVVMQSLAQPAAPGMFITLDLGADTPINFVAMLFTTFSPGALWFVQGTTNAAGTGPLDAGTAQILGFSGFTAFGVAPTISTNRRHAFAATPGAVVNVRYIRITIAEVGLAAGSIFCAGIVYVGQVWGDTDPINNFELGAGRKIVDLSLRRELDDGGLAFWRKAKVPMFRATWSNLTDAQLAVLWAMLSDIGESQATVLVEDVAATAGQNERIHYGVLEGLDFYERAQVGKSRIDLRIRDWL